MIVMVFSTSVCYSPYRKILLPIYNSLVISQQNIEKSKLDIQLIADHSGDYFTCKYFALIWTISR